MQHIKLGTSYMHCLSWPHIFLQTALHTFQQPYIASIGVTSRASRVSNLKILSQASQAASEISKKGLRLCPSKFTTEYRYTTRKVNTTALFSKHLIHFPENLMKVALLLIYIGMACTLYDIPWTICTLSGILGLNYKSPPPHTDFTK